MKPWSYTFCNRGLVHGPGFPFSMPSWFGTFNAQLSVCCVVMIIWASGRCESRNMSLEGEIPHSLASGTRNYSERWGSRSTAQWRTLVLEESLVTHTRASWIQWGAVWIQWGWAIPSKTFQHRNKHSKGSGDLTKNRVTSGKSLTSLNPKESPLFWETVQLRISQE